MFDAYKSAAELKAGGKATASYSVLNAMLAYLSLAFVTRPSAKTKDLKDKVIDTCGRIAAECRLANRAQPDLWMALDEPNALMIGALAKGDLPDRKDDIIALYRCALRRGASQAQIASLIDQIRFIETMLPARNEYETMRRAVEDIVRLAKDELRRKNS
jgi:hypothetical protein